ncbi:MAG TPA: sensor histidine kinase [Chitinophagaceae bacterium]|nr:sensor histidine kinase [Chitinophagaceae bacterium]
MEYDNDRPRRRSSKIEWFFWVWLWAGYPLINGLLFLPGSLVAWPLLFGISLVFLPAYFLYARLVVPWFLFQHRVAAFVLLSLGWMALLQVLLFAMFALMDAWMQGRGIHYFRYSGLVVGRETLWMVANLVFSAAISFAAKAIEQGESLHSMVSENQYLKIRSLRSQLNPHFLFNTLNSIYSLSLSQPDRVPETVIKLADLMRYLIYECNQEKVPLEKEIEFIRNYIAIEQMRFKADIRYTVEGDARGLLIEPFLFMSFVENSFKHAMSQSEREPFVYITVRASAREVTLHVLNSSDTDLGTQAARLGGRGIMGSRGLLEMLYPNAYSLDIIQTAREERQHAALRLRHARERLEALYPDAYTLDVMLKHNTFAVSLVIKSMVA